MTDIVERLRKMGGIGYEAADEIERLRHACTTMALQSLDKEKRLMAEIARLGADKALISQTASDYLHEIDRLRNYVIPTGAYDAV